MFAVVSARSCAHCAGSTLRERCSMTNGTWREKLRIRHNAAGLTMEGMGTLLLFLAHMRADEMLRLVGYSSFDGEPTRFQHWFYHAESLGFLLVALGLILHVNLLRLEQGWLKGRCAPAQ